MHCELFYEHDEETVYLAAYFNCGLHVDDFFLDLLRAQVHFY